MGQMLAECILAASGAKTASLVLKHAKVVNVFTKELELFDIAIEDNMIVGVGEYEGIEEIDMEGFVVCPGLIDGHIHLESSMVVPEEFERLVVPHGTQAVVTDPHEIANVAGAEGIRFMMNRARNLTLSVYFMMPSCVPATSLDEAGAVLHAKELAPFYQEEQVLGLAELMNSYGTIHGDEEILNKITDVKDRKLVIDGHAPGLSGKDLNAYVTAGVQSDHECSNVSEAIEKIRRGQWVMIREGTAARNLEALLPLFQEPYYHRCMLVTDDRHPGELIHLGHLDYIIKKAISLGADPIHAIMMSTIHPAKYFGLQGVGAIAPGYKANFIVVSDLKNFEVKQVYIEGKLVAKDGKMIAPISNRKKSVTPASVGDSFHLPEISQKNLRIEKTSETIRVLCLTPGELTTTEYQAPWVENSGVSPGVCIDKDIVKMAVLERHKGNGHIGLGFVKGYGLKRGAVATSIAHDSHNLIIIGTNDEDMALAGNIVRNNGGGLAVVADGKLLGELPLPIAGLMSEEQASLVDEKLEELKSKARELGIGEGIDPFMTLAFASLPVIPKLRLNTYGLIDVEKQAITTVCM